MATVPATRFEEILASLQAGGARVTSARRAVLRALVEADQHVTADDIAAAVQEHLPDVHRSTIYRTLEALEELGVVDHVHLGHGRAVYHLADDRHQHLVCESCGTVVEVPDTLFEPLRKRALDGYGFTIQPHHFAVLGRCGPCAGAP